MRVIIINNDPAYCEELSATFSSSGYIDIAGIANKGSDALEMLQKTESDVILLDFILPEADGLQVLDTMNKSDMKQRPAVIMLSSFATDTAIRQAEKLGADYFIIRPFDKEVLCQRINEVYVDKCEKDKLLDKRSIYFINEPGPGYFTTTDMEEAQDKEEATHEDLEWRVSGIMNDIGVPINLTGYIYIKKAILHTIELKRNPKYRKSLMFTRDVYPYVAFATGRTVKHVQQNIRNTINRTWQRGGQDFINSIFGYTINYTKGRPTNTEFICMMSDKVMLMEGIL